MKRIVVFISLLVAISLVLAGCGTLNKPANHLEAIKQAGVIKVGTSADYPPFESVDANGVKVGFDIDLMTEIAKRLNVKLEWVDMPFDSLIAAVQEGKIDASISAFNYTEERDKTIDFSAPYYTSEDSFTVADGFAGTIAKPEDVAAYKVGVQTGTTQDSWLTDNLVADGALPEGNLFRYDRVDQAMLDLKNGRIEVMMSDYVPAQALAKQLGGLNIVYHGVLSSGPMNIVIPEKDVELAQAINDIIKQLQGEGFVDGLAVKYFAQ
ncbi:MAG TPA: ABC transporter substrate-binding protein [Anaerolineales bacterium]|nr:ABC transporter substrate-binding protein [Anaerolineales bacterium]